MAKGPLSGLLLAVSIALPGCGGDQDPTLYLTGTEEAALSGQPGSAPTCAAGKVLICHRPPGNQPNAHDICVSAAAADAHANHHSDTVGGCTATCAVIGQPCGPSQLCCGTLFCAQGICTR